MKNEVLKMIFFILILIIAVFLSNLKVFAIEPSEVLTDTPIQGGDELEQLGGSILGIIMVGGVILAVVVLIVIGIKYMTGSVEEKAGYKKAMMPYVIGCVILVGAPAIANIAYEISNNFNASKVIITTYHPNPPGCGKISQYCTYGCSDNRMCYYCTGCERILDESHCVKCDISYENE